ncbi:hypothetical protein DC31_02110 [Microbacterium sp. CH12i]|nr:hypothetical protein DC31_02110 [Microbacterium sp. CH12i]
MLGPGDDGVEDDLGAVDDGVAVVASGKSSPRLEMAVLGYPMLATFSGDLNSAEVARGPQIGIEVFTQSHRNGLEGWFATCGYNPVDDPKAWLDATDGLEVRLEAIRKVCRTCAAFQWFPRDFAVA